MIRSRADRSSTVATSGDNGNRGGGTLAALLMAVALGALLTQTWRACSRTHIRRTSARPEAQPRPLQTWEGEGGNVDPVPVSQPSAARQA